MQVSTRPPTAPGPLTLEIAAILRAEVARQSMSVVAFARKVGTISRPQVAKILDGQKPIDIEDLDRLTHTLGLDLKKVLREADEATEARHLPEKPTS